MAVSGMPKNLPAQRVGGKSFPSMAPAKNRYRKQVPNSVHRLAGH